jgi:hypothetical protein
VSSAETLAGLTHGGCDGEQASRPPPQTQEGKRLGAPPLIV